MAAENVEQLAALLRVSVAGLRSAADDLGIDLPGDDAPVDDDSAERLAAWLRAAPSAPDGFRPHRVGPGEVIGRRYRLEERIGQGGMGTVWRARHLTLHSAVAVKQLTGHDAVSPADAERRVRRALREGRILADSAPHPNVVDVTDLVEEDGTVWLVMRLVEGRTLTQYVRERPPLSAEQFHDLGRQLAGALEHVHASRIVHRDIKPDNIVITPEQRVVLVDFGIAYRDGEESITQTDVVIGTPAYFDPERAQGRPAESASDMFCLGAVLHYAAEGANPFGHRANTPAWLHAIANEPPAPVTRLPGAAPLIARLLDKDPARRPTATALLALLAARPAPVAAFHDAATVDAEPAPVRVRAPQPVREGPDAFATPAEFFAGLRDLYEARRGGRTLEQVVGTGNEKFYLNRFRKLLSETPNAGPDGKRFVVMLVSRLGCGAKEKERWSAAWQRAWDNRGPRTKSYGPDPLGWLVAVPLAALYVLYGSALSAWSDPGPLGSGNVWAFTTSSVLLALFLLFLHLLANEGFAWMVSHGPYYRYFRNTFPLTLLICLALLLTTALLAPDLGLGPVGHAVRDRLAWRF